MPNSKRQTTFDNLSDLIRNLGAEPVKGTNADLLDQLEVLLAQGGSDAAAIRAAVTALLQSSDGKAIVEPAIEAYMESNRGELSDSDLDDIFGGD